MILFTKYYDFYHFSNEHLCININKLYINKKELLDFYKNKLFFPHFGANWDSFEDCITDLSWTKWQKIFIIHDIIPLEGDLVNQRIYLNILFRASRIWDERGEISFIVYFNNAILQMPPWLHI